MQAMSGQLDGPHMWTVENRKAPWLLLAPRIPSLCHNSSMAKKMWSPGSRGLPLTENNLGVCAYQAYQFSTESWEPGAWTASSQVWRADMEALWSRITAVSIHTRSPRNQNDLQYLTISYDILRYLTISYDILRYLTISYDILQYLTISYNILQYLTISYNILQYLTISYNILQYLTISYNILQYLTISYNILQYLTISYNILQYFSLRVNYRRGNVSHCHCQHVSLGQVGSHGRCHPSQRSQGSYERRVLGPTRTGLPGLANFLWMSLVNFGKVSIGFWCFCPKVKPVHLISLVHRHPYQNHQNHQDHQDHQDNQDQDSKSASIDRES